MIIREGNRWRLDWHGESWYYPTRYQARAVLDYLLAKNGERYGARN